MDSENAYRRISHSTSMSLLQADGANKKGSALFFFHVDHIYLIIKCHFIFSLADITNIKHHYKPTLKNGVAFT